MYHTIFQLRTASRGLGRRWARGICPEFTVAFSAYRITTAGRIAEYLGEGTLWLIANCVRANFPREVLGAPDKPNGGPFARLLMGLGVQLRPCSPGSLNPRDYCGWVG